MIEAITAAVSNSQLVRQVAEQSSTMQSYSSNPSRVQSAAISAPYLSPHVNLNAGKPIFIVRDSETGESLRQFPTEGQIKTYQNAQAKSQEFARSQAAQAGNQQVEQQQNVTSDAAAAEIVKSSVEFKQIRQEVKVKEFNPGGHKSEGPKLVSGQGSEASVSEKPAKVITSVDTKA